MSNPAHILRITVIAGLFALLTACSVFQEQQTVEELAPVTFLALSTAEDGKLEISTLAPPLTNDKKFLMTIKVDMIKEGRKRLNLRFYREFKFGQLRFILFDEKLARQGIAPILNTILVDNEISQRIYFVVVKGDMNDYLRNNLEKQPNLDYFLYRMFRHYERDNQGQITVVNLHQFVKKLYSPYADPILPVVETNADSFQYEGTAFFKGDKLVGTINRSEDHIFQLIGNRHYLKAMPLAEILVTLGQVRAKTDMEWIDRTSTLNLTIRLSGRIEEYRGDRDLNTLDGIKEVHAEIKALMEKRTLTLLEQLRDRHVDPLQIGKENLKPFGKPPSEAEWEKKRDRMNIKVKYELDIEPLTFLPKNPRS